MIPHPDKADKGGEDALFVSNSQRMFGEHPLQPSLQRNLASYVWLAEVPQSAAVVTLTPFSHAVMRGVSGAEPAVMPTQVLCQSHPLLWFLLMPYQWCRGG